jgi:D-alanyl-D-alanine dipeptidase
VHSRGARSTSGRRWTASRSGCRRSTTRRRASRAIALAGDRGAEAQARRGDDEGRFVGIKTEWWHFDAKDGAKYSLADEPL